MPPNRSFIILVFILILIINDSCKKFITVTPPDIQLPTSTVFANDSTATAAVVGIYETISASRGYFGSGRQSITVLSGLTADELDNYSGASEWQQFWLNEILPSNSLNAATWRQLYRCVYLCNIVLEGLAASRSVTLAANHQLSGEALFLRAFFYFYLVNLYGPVPLALTTNYRFNNTLYRSSQEMVYAQIINDLLAARELLTDEYTSGTLRIRANRSAANALLSRVYLYTQQWQLSVEAASQVLHRRSQYQLSLQPADAFLKYSSESILQLYPAVPNSNTFDAEIFLLTDIPTQFACRTNLITAFEAGDERRSEWIDSVNTIAGTFYFPCKYRMKTGSDLKEFLTLLRLAELYLIRAESYAHMGQLHNAIQDLNAIRKRAKLPLVQTASQDSILVAIYKERRVELFTEWGHRWLDLKRSGQANVLLSTIKTPRWNIADTLYPIPQSEITLNPHLTQNTGYE